MPDLKATHAQICNGHRESGGRFAESRAAAHTAFQDLLHVEERARRVLKETGAETTEPEGNLAVGWYGNDLAYQERHVTNSATSAAWVVGGVAALVGALAIQLGALTAMGGFETGSDQAVRWFGVASFAIGGLDLALTPFVLGCIFLGLGAVLLLAAALISRSRNRQAERAMNDANIIMKEAMERMEANEGRLRELGNQAKDVAEELSRATGAFQSNQNQVTLDNVNRVLDRVGQLYSDACGPLPHARLYLEKPSPVDSLSSIEATMSSVTIRWEDPDLGNTEIDSYRILQAGGFLRSDKDLATVNETEFTHDGLNQGKAYDYRIIPVNKLGEAADNRMFEARTQEA